jgi:hypothetical protein
MLAYDDEPDFQPDLYTTIPKLARLYEISEQTLYSAVARNRLTGVRYHGRIYVNKNLADLYVELHHPKKKGES